MSDSDENSEILEVANAAISNMLPAKSKEVYEKTYGLFRKWCIEKNVRKVTENVMLAYLEEKSKTVKSVTLWSTYSMLRATLNVKENVDLKQFPRLIPYLKSKSVGYKSKKSSVFTRNDIDKFMSEANDQDFLLMKCALALGIAGACRREELTKLRIQDIEDTGRILIINIPDTKTHTDRTFVVTDENDVKLYRKYRSLRPSNASSDRFFLRYSKGRCLNQNVGVNKIGELPSKIAQFLGKVDSKKYTGHAFRRSSATLLANSGGSITRIKRHGGWKSTSVAEGYIEESIANKIETSNRISGSQLACSSKGVHNDQSDINLVPTNFIEYEKNDDPAINKDEDLEEVQNKTSRGTINEQAVPQQSMLSTSLSATSGIHVGNNCTNCVVKFYYVSRQ